MELAFWRMVQLLALDYFCNNSCSPERAGTSGSGQIPGCEEHQQIPADTHAQYLLPSQVLLCQPCSQCSGHEWISVLP